MFASAKKVEDTELLNQERHPDRPKTPNFVKKQLQYQHWTRKWFGYTFDQNKKESDNHNTRVRKVYLPNKEIKATQICC